MANVSNVTNAVLFHEFSAAVLIWKIVPPILIVFGTVGNSLSILVLTRRSIRSSTTALYLTVLAFSDLLVLYSGLLRQWLRFLFDVDVRHISEFGCKLHVWLVYCSLDFSAWILLLVTVERVISAWLPHKARKVCTKKFAVALLISAGVFLICLNSHMFYGMVFRYTKDSSGKNVFDRCVEKDDGYAEFFNVIWPWIDLCVFCLIPFAVIVAGNALIVLKVIKSQRKVKVSVVAPAPNRNTRQSTSNNSSNQSMIAMLLTLNVVFLVSTSPISIYNVGYAHWIIDATEHELAQLDIWWAIVNMLMYVNNSLNFLLYCLSGSKFRHEVTRIFTSWKQRASTANIEMPHSYYSRPKFDGPLASPSTRIAVTTIQGDIGDANRRMGNEEGVENLAGPSSNNLHPMDALKERTVITGLNDSCVKVANYKHSNAIEVNTH